MNEILLYGPIWSESSSIFINAVNELEGDNLTVRINSGGGEPTYGWGMVAKFSEFSGTKNVKVDGSAYSMAAFFCCYSDNVECLDVSQFLIHRAAMSQWYEQEYMSDSERDNLVNINVSLEKAFRNKIDVAKFEQIKGVKVKDIFSMENRIDVFLTATEAKQIGLISKITTITPKKKTEINASMNLIAASYGFDVMSMNKPAIDSAEEKKESITSNSKTQIKMTIEQLKADHPELFVQVTASAIKEEKDRVGAWMKFIGADADAVVKGIESGENLGQTAMADFTVKMITNAGTVEKIGAEGAAVVIETKKPEGVEKTAAELFQDKVNASLNPEIK